MEKEHPIFGNRAIIEAIQAGAAVDKVFIQKEIQVKNNSCRSFKSQKTG